MHLALTGVPLPLRFRPDTPMSDDDLMRFCADNEDLRVEREETGEIYVMTPAGMNTGRKNSYIIQALTAWADQDGRGYAFDSNTGWTLPDGSMRSPDAAWALASRCDALSEADQNRFAPLCPEFIIELRSQSDRLSELQAKMQKWINNGTELAWLIDPLEKTVTIYRPHDSPEHHYHPTSVQGTGSVRGFELILDRIWA